MSDTRISSFSATPQSLTSAQGAQAGKNLRDPALQGDSAKIEKAARNFESLLVGHWLDQAEKSFGSVPGKDPDEDQDSSHDQFRNLACEALAQGLSSKGGFGIAKMIAKRLEAAASVQTHGSGSPAESAGSGALGHKGFKTGTLPER
jgi:Rod binding domain-containing protein